MRSTSRTHSKPFAFNWRRIVLGIGCLLMAYLFCLKFSLTTSVLYSIKCTDQSIFYIIGKYWAQGHLPYVELWDHKGPLIFLINCLGFSLTGSEAGIFIIQVLSLSVFIYFTFLSFSLFFKPFISCLLTIVSLFWLACSYEGGNLTEEYLLPFLAAAIYLTIIWLQNNERKPNPHNPWQAFLFGVILGFCFLTRLTNALSSCGAMFAIFLILTYQKQWVNLLKNIIMYVLGFCFLTIPFFVYFSLKGGLDEMLFGTLFYNFENIVDTTSRSIRIGFGNNNLLLFSIMSVNSIGLIAVSIFSILMEPKQRASSLVWLFASLLITIWLLSSNLCSHYRTLIVPFFPILLKELIRIRIHFPRLAIVLSALIIIGPIFLTLRKWNSFVDYFDNSQTIDRLVTYVEETVPDSEMNSFVGWNICQGVYVALDVKPCYRNFSLQQSQYPKSNRLRTDILKEFSSLQAKSILVYGTDTLIDPILKAHYSPASTNCPVEGYRLWLLNIGNDERD